MESPLLGCALPSKVGLSGTNSDLIGPNTNTEYHMETTKKNS